MLFLPFKIEERSRLSPMKENGNQIVNAPVFVEGLDISAYGISRSLGRHGIPVVSLDGQKKDFLRFSRYCRGCYTFPNDPERQRTYKDDIIPNEQVLLDLLLSWRKQFTSNPVIFATSDWFTRFLCDWRERLSSEFLFHWVPKDVFTTITEKGAVAEFCEKVGVSIPITRIFRSEDDVSSIAKEVPYPCLVKPIHRQTVTFPIAAKVFVARNPQELESFLSANPQLRGATLVQEMIEGDDDTIFQCTVLMKNSGDSVCATVRKLHQCPPHYGTMCHGTTEPNEEIIAESLKLLRPLGYRGLGSLEFKYLPRTNRYYFIEMNTRLPWYNGIFSDGGVNLPYLSYLDLTGRPDDSEMRATRQRDMIWTSYRHYSGWYRAIQKERPTSWWRWVGSIARVRSFAWWNWRDPGPYVASLLFGLRGAIGRGLRRAGLRA
jgi:D-aspartate ligase